MKSTWKIAFKDANKRLDVFVSETGEGVTRSQAKKQIETGAFLVNGKTVSGHHFLKEGDVITRSDKLVAAKLPHTKRHIVRSEHVGAINLRIIEETPDWLVVVKPAGVLMHPDHANPTGTLIDAVMKHAPMVAKIGEDPSRPGIMSRLDKDVSGLVVIAKTQDAFEDLKQQFANHSVKKEYLALVFGEMELDEGEIRFRIGRSTTKARMAAFPESSKHGQAAWTHYVVEDRFPDATLIKLQILTGRTHQIRAHLFALQHPVAGDSLYKMKSVDRKIVAPRLMLESVLLEFNDPTTKERRTFTIEPDKAFEEVMKVLRKNK